MSKMKELATVLDELVACGETLISTANALKDIFSGDAYISDSPAPTETADSGTKPTPASKNKKKPAASKPEPAPEPEPLTKETVRGILAAKSAEGHGDEIRALLKKYGAKQLKQVDPSDYAVLVKDAESIGSNASNGNNAGSDSSTDCDSEATAAEEDSDE